MDFSLIDREMRKILSFVEKTTLSSAAVGEERKFSNSLLKPKSHLQWVA